jgi:hypothetical protein
MSNSAGVSHLTCAALVAETVEGAGEADIGGRTLRRGRPLSLLSSRAQREIARKRADEKKNFRLD